VPIDELDLDLLRRVRLTEAGRRLGIRLQQTAITGEKTAPGVSPHLSRACPQANGNTMIIETSHGDHPRRTT
jgi:hypothetical protein